jgi:hypothetical protein
MEIDISGVPMARRAAGAVAASMAGCRFPLVLGREHCLSQGSSRGAAKKGRLG